MFCVWLSLGLEMTKCDDFGIGRGYAEKKDERENKKAMTKEEPKRDPSPPNIHLERHREY